MTGEKRSCMHAPRLKARIERQEEEEGDQDLEGEDPPLPR